MLWTGSIYLLRKAAFHWICTIPALFMTAVVSVYIFYAPEGFGLDYKLSMILGSVIWVAVLIWFLRQWKMSRPIRSLSPETLHS